MTGSVPKAQSNVRNFAELVHPDFALARHWPDVPVKVLIPLTGIFGWCARLLNARPQEISTRVERLPTADGKDTFPAYLAWPTNNENPSMRRTSKLLPGLLWIHGGGMVVGTYKTDLKRLHDLVKPSPDILPDGCVILAPDYRLAPAHPAPALVDDCFTAWQWMVSRSDELGIDTSRLVVAGASAGGGLAAVTVQRILDDSKTSGGPLPKLQLLLYPMLDDRTVPRIEGDMRGGSYQTKYPLWSPASNSYGWRSYLGGVDPGSNLSEKLQSQVAARRANLSGLPNAWIGVGDLDLFFHENVLYAERLRAAGIDVTLEVVQGGFHGFEAFGSSKIVSAFWRSQVEALRSV